MTKESFLEELDCLHEAAGSPGMQNIARWTELNHPPGVKLRTLSGWFAGGARRHVPRSVSEKDFAVVVEYLLDRAGKTTTIDAEVGKWVKWLREANTTRSAPKVVVVGKIPAEAAYFVTRDQLRRLAHALAGSRVVVVVTGMMGAGKTQLAAAYARSTGATVVGWVNAATDGTLLEGLADIAERLRVADPEGDSQRSAHLLRDHLASRAEEGLLVFDNASDPDRVCEFIPARGGTRVIITSTDHDFTTLGTRVQVEVYSRAESVGFLTAATGLVDDHGADQVAEDLGDLPLALTQAANTITTLCPPDYASYRQLLAQPMPRAFTCRAGESHPHPVDKAILLSLETIEAPTGDPELDTAVRELLEIMAMLSPAGVSVAILPDKPGRLREALARCVRGSLLTRSTTGESVTMHCLIARVLRERAGTDHTLAQLAANALTVIEGNLFDRSQAWQRRAEGAHLIDQIDAIWKTGAHTTSAEVTTRLFRARAWASRQLSAAADTARGVTHSKQTLTDAEHWLEPDHPLTLAARNNLAHAYFSAGRLRKGIRLYKRNLIKAKRVLGANDHHTFLARNNLAGGYRSVGRVAEAITLYERNLPNVEHWLEPDDHIIFTTRNNLASAYESVGRFPEAIRLYKRNLAEAEHWSETDNITTLNNLAGAYTATNNPLQAIPLLEQTLTDAERALGANDHPKLLTIRHTLANAYASTERFPEAIRLYKQILPELEQTFGANHPRTRTTRENLAKTYRLVAEAIEWYEQILTDHKRVLAPDHPDVCALRNLLTTLRRSQDECR
ncbi:tetratricopeptide repeat protein [Nocardia sp. NBC_00881]|uniref:tetratricopeptide repeat protein n=1 Tax=Nocardia sp. NBC_00881 TaxID=2975995 RepID=UPI003863B652|nr:tetratricopeptide repeat protein [Nocardia sp. NBC_00881]